MNPKSGWLTLILITTVHIVLSLIGVVLLFSWFGNWTHEAMTVRSTTINRATSGQLAKEINSLGISDVSSASTEDISRLKGLITKLRMPNYGFISIVDPASGTSICENPELPELLQPGVFAALTFDNGEKLLDVAGLPPAQHFSNGTIDFNHHAHFAAVTYLPGADVVLVVAQQPNGAVVAVKDRIRTARRLFFTGVLLLGLIGLTMTLFVVNSITSKIELQNAALDKEITERGVKISKTQNAVIFGLAKLAESRDNDTGEHLDRIRSYVLLLAKDLASSRPELQKNDFVHNLTLASSLHDVGKVGIPDSILLKPGRLTPAEREVMELHTLIGGECLEAIQSRLGEDNPFMQLAIQIALYHHERWDGHGYPHRLASDKIPVAARIVAVADVYDALTSKRPYKKPLSHLESKGIILAGSGSQFDPEIVAAFIRHEEAFESISRGQQALSDNEVRSEFQTLCERAKELAEEKLETATAE